MVCVANVGGMGMSGAGILDRAAAGDGAGRGDAEGERRHSSETAPGRPPCRGHGELQKSAFVGQCRQKFGQQFSIAAGSRSAQWGSGLIVASGHEVAALLDLSEERPQC
jgi:hypothetical protein